MMKKMIRKANIIRMISLLLCVCACLGISGCAGGAEDTHAEDEEGSYKIYCLDRDENTLPYYVYDTDTTDRDKLTEELIGEMSKTPEDIRNKEIIRDFTIISAVYEEQQLVLTVSDDYANLPPTKEVLTRAALVRTLGQIEGVDHILFRLKGGDLTDASGQPVGPMRADTFIDNPGNEINSYESIDLELYFADPDGNSLTKINRSVEYNTSMSVEKLVVEQLIKGTDAEQLRSTVNPATQIINVTVKDGICYVNLDDGFLLIPDGIRPEVMLYSIVDSLAELPGIQKVQFSIDGETNIKLTDNLVFSTLFERNLDIVN